jgi:sugar transferase (PEP-CTERM/EpsH1 system associated)
MKILYVCHRFPFPPKRGGKIRPFNMIRHLHEQGHQVTVASHVRSPAEAREGKGLEAHCTRVLSGRIDRTAAVGRMLLRLPTTTPSSMGYFYSPELARQIRDTLATESFDLIFVHCSSVAQYVEQVKGVPKILDFGDMDSQKWLEYARHRTFPFTLGYWLEGTKLCREEKRLATRFDLCTATTRGELDTLDSYRTGTASGWFPNGVDAEFFSPDPLATDEDLICFVGRMDYYPNQQAMFDFCRDVWPGLQSLRPATRLAIVGADPSPAVQRLARLDGVTVTGSVPDVRPHVRSAVLTVAPLSIARGTQNKILESMAMGVPVVCSPMAARGVDAVPGEHLLVADSPTEYRETILSLLENPALRARFASDGRERVLTHHDWAASMRRLDALIAATVGVASDEAIDVTARSRTGESTG